MTGLEELLSKRWIIKNEDKEKYYLIRDNMEEIRKYVTDKLGCQLIVNPHMIKIEKIPATPAGYMGITEFSEKREYVFLCLILMFLEDKEAQEQFVLSQLTEYIAANIVNERIDWTVYSLRKQLIKVMRFCMGNSIFKITDGDEDEFTQDDSIEVLYENTGLSKYFMKTFTKDIMKYSSVSEFEQSDWVGIDEDRGIARRHRVYKRLLFSHGIYRESNDDEDFEYLKYYGNRLSEDFERNFNCRLQIYKSSAYLILNESCRLGEAFPAGNTLSDIILLFNNYLLERIRTAEINTEWDESVIMDEVEFEKHILECRRECVGGLVKTYRDMTSTEFVRKVQEYMENLGFINRNSLTRQIKIRPVIGKISGHFPKNFDGEGNV